MNNRRKRPDRLDIVIPVFNEDEAIGEFFDHLSRVVRSLEGIQTRYLFIDDGSTDGTADMITQMDALDERIHLISLSRNFGHQAAITAGLDHSDADCVITMDGDGQHPPEMIQEMIEQYMLGYDIVLAQRVDNGDEGFFKRVTSHLFYRFLRFLSDTQMVPGVADFRLLSGEVVAQLKQMREYHRYLRGMVSWLGFRVSILPYSVSRRIAGKSKYSLKKMIRLSMDAVFSFSLVPLYIGIGLGALFLLGAVIEAGYVLSLWLRGMYNQLAPGWSSLMFMLLVVGGVLMIMLGVVGLYIGYIFQEVKHRPLYVIKSSGE